MSWERMTSFYLRHTGRFKQFCIFLCTLLAGWLCGKLGLKAVPATAELLPAGCRPIPVSNYDFDPALARELGGRDGTNRAIILQYIYNWLAFNEKTGRNHKEGRTWTYNSGRDWTAAIGLWGETAVKAHIHFLEGRGLLDSKPMNAHKGDQTKWYSAPHKESDGWTQMPLLPDEKSPMGGRKAANDSSIDPTAIGQPSIQKASTAAAARGRRPMRAGVVAEFPGHIPGREPAERKAEQPETRPEADEHEAYNYPGTRHAAGLPKQPPISAPPPLPDDDATTEAETKSSGDTPPVDVPEWMPGFFTGCTGEELLDMLADYGEATLMDSKTYALNPDHRILNPAGFVRSQLARGWRPPAKVLPGTAGRSYIDHEYADFIEH